MKQSDIIVKTLFGLENVLADELNTLGLQEIAVLNRAVKCQGTLEDIYAINLRARTALKVLLPIAVFTADHEDELYHYLYRLRWFDYLSPQQTFSIEATVSGDFFKHSKYIALKTKDAIVDYFRNKIGKRPSVDTISPDIYFNIHIHQNMVTLSLDSTGQTLDRRGYRLQRNDAPLNEVLAAGILLLSGWDKKSTLYDPMCGSGTFSVEAALMACRIPPGHLRSFAFQHWQNFDSILWEKVKKEANDQIIEWDGQIYARDIDSRSIDITIQNGTRAGVEDYIMVKKEDFFESSPKGETGFLLFNPPYGERMRQDQIVDFYKQIGSHLKQYYQNHDAWIISSNMEAIKYFGLKPSKKMALYNGALPCKLQGYELYKGSKRAPLLTEN